MLVSVLIPTRNRLKMLKQAVASAQAQTHQTLEILISDDGSIDGTVAWAENAYRRDPRIRILADNPEPGIFTNINHLIANATGNAFVVLADDDLLGAKFVERLAAPLEEHPDVVVAFCDHDIIDNAGRRLDELTASISRHHRRDVLPAGRVADPVSVALDRSICVGFALYRTTPFRSRPFDVSCGAAADVEQGFVAGELGAMWYVPDRLGSYRHHAGTATVMQQTWMANSLISTLDRRVFTDPRHEQKRRALLSEALRWKAFNECSSDRREALRCVRRYCSMGGSPTDPKIAASTVLALTPRSLARAGQSWLRRVQRRRVRSRSANDDVLVGV